MVRHAPLSLPPKSFLYTVPYKLFVVLLKSNNILAYIIKLAELRNFIALHMSSVNTE